EYQHLPTIRNGLFGCRLVAEWLTASPFIWGITTCRFCMLSFQMIAFCVVVTTVVQIVMGVPSGTLVHTLRDVGIDFI
ncbi:hypothetical protein EFL90_13520, partial [Lactococcus lactis]|uniref:hypothetical protein n=1 Tax=Lactococcus lactis TaxID=1358 RepID=UPI00223BF868